MTEHGDRVQRIKAVTGRLMASPAMTYLDEGPLIELDEPMAQVAEGLDTRRSTAARTAALQT